MFGNLSRARSFSIRSSFTSGSAWRALAKSATTGVLTAGLLHATFGSSGCQGELEQTPSLAVEAQTTHGPFSALTSALGGDAETSFAVELSTAVRTPDGHGAGKQVHGYDLSGNWRLLPVDVEGQRWILARLQLDRFELGYGPTGLLSKAEHEAHLRTQFQRAILLEVSAQGEVLQIKAPADLTALALGGLKALASHFQFAPAGANGARTWQATELDTVGEYKAKYTQPSSTEVVRKKDAYLRLVKQGALRTLSDQAPPTLHSEDRFTLDASRRVTAIRSRESLGFAATQMLPELSSDTAITAHRVNVTVSTLRATEAEALLELPARPFIADPPDASRRFDLDIAKVGDLRSVDEALTRLDALSTQAGATTGAEVKRLELGLGALIRLSSSAEEEAWSLLQSTPARAEVLRLTLTQTPRPESQQRLVQLVRDGAGLSLEEQSRLLMALAENPLPSKQLLSSLIELRKTTTLRDTVLMAIGGVCHEAMASDPALALEALQHLQAELVNTAARPEKLAVALRALGNAGHPRVWEESQPYLAHDSDVVRAAAVRALRRVEDPRVDMQLESMRASDTSESVQKVVLAIADQRQQRSLGRVR